MGESVAEATITSWLKEVGDTIEADEAVLEIATDKLDSEVPSEVDGVLVEKLFNVDDVVNVGQTIAIIETDGDAPDTVAAPKEESTPEPEAAQEVAKTVEVAKETAEIHRAGRPVLVGTTSVEKKELLSSLLSEEKNSS